MLANTLKLRMVMLLAGHVLLVGTALADISFRNLDDPDAPRWEEEEATLPPFPQETNLREFYASAVTTNRFFVDTASLSVGKDGVVRYALVVRTSGGATNTSFEGIRCETRELKIYATGHRDGTWVKARVSAWRLIESKQVNRHHVALAREMFCPNGLPLQSPAEGREALRLGRHPDVP